MIVGSLATIGVIVTWQQKNRADRRSEWWRRTAWAFERTFDESNSKAGLGWSLLATLMRSRLVTVDDGDIVQVIAEYAALADTGKEGSHGSRREA
ncbi:hypothetical protein [Mycolicibacter icosiumassiliensis]|uniref:hypothetical protein n=1 Tax=Mycolicibacter icosiumassiliensis TaxID=1792835 RepID=UPI000B09007C|nr:hypothetical protein [Mycolicibacter icosiumassiliensis]